MEHQVFCHTISLGVYDSKHLLIDYFLIILLIHKNTKQILQPALSTIPTMSTIISDVTRFSFFFLYLDVIHFMAIL